VSDCSAYDCEFVALAKRLNSPLITADKKVLKAFPEFATTITEFIISKS
jgi:predicted nucleic acid-binding protein